MKKLFFLLFTSLAFASNVEISSIETGNSGVEAQTVEMLARDAIIKQGDSPVSSADTKLRIHLMPLGQSIVVIAEVEKNGEIESSAKLKAESAEELDIVIERVVQGALKNESSKDNEEVTNISEKEQTELITRKETRNYRHISIGPSFWHNTSGENLMGVAANYAWIFEAAPQGAIVITDNNSFSFGEEWIVHTTILIGGRYYFNANRISPYAGLGLGVGFAYGNIENADTDIWGFAWGVSTGVVFFRTSSTQLELGVSYDYLLSGFDFGDGSAKLGVTIGINY